MGESESICRSTVHSIGRDPYRSGHHTEMVATVTFENLHPQLANENSQIVEGEAEFQGEWRRMSLSFNLDFLGFTPLNEVDYPEDEIIE